MKKTAFLISGLVAILTAGMVPQASAQLTLATMTATQTDFTDGDYLVGLQDDLSDEIKLAITAPIAALLSSDDDFEFATTWNDGGTLFSAITLDVTDTASDANSLLMDLRVAAASQFSVSKVGNVAVNGTVDGVDLADLQTLSGVATGSTDLGTFTGSIITDNVTTKTAMQELETALQSGGFDSTVIVQQASDLSGTLSGTTLYYIDGAIDMGSQTITVPSGGLSIRGLSNNISILSSTQASYTMFIDADDSGSVYIGDVTVTVSGTSSQVFDLDASGAGSSLVLSSVRMTNCTSVGELDAFGGILMTDNVWTGCADGITLSGTMTAGVRLDGFIVRTFGSSGIVFEEGTSLTMPTRFLSDANMDLPSGAVGYDFSASVFTNDADFELISGEYSGAGTVSSVLTGTETAARFQENNFPAGQENTYPGGSWTLTTESTTTISTVNTPVKAAGTTTYSDLEWMSNTTDNAFVYDSTKTLRVEIKGTVSFSGGNGDEVGVILRQWDDSASGYTDIREHGSVTLSGTGTGQNIALLGYADLDENDRVEVWVENRSDTSNVTMLEDSFVSIVED